MCLEDSSFSGGMFMYVTITIVIDACFASSLLVKVLSTPSKAFLRACYHDDGIEISLTCQDGLQIWGG